MIHIIVCDYVVKDDLVKNPTFWNERIKKDNSSQSIKGLKRTERKIDKKANIFQRSDPEKRGSSFSDRPKAERPVCYQTIHCSLIFADSKFVIE